MKNGLLFCVLVSVLLVSCGGTDQESSLVNMILSHDCVPPVLIAVEVLTSDSAGIIFDEDVSPLEKTFENCRVYSSGSYLHVDFDRKLNPGESLHVSGTVEDRYRNTTTFNVIVWGLNTNPAVLRINEFTTKGSKTQPDRTELKAVHGGSIAGMVLYDGVPDSWRSMAVLPDYEVQAGTFVTVWWCDSLPQNVQAVEDSNINIAAGGGLSENNGIMCLCLSPMQEPDVLDCVVWSSMASTQFEGYGTREVWQRVSQALENGWWTGTPVYSGFSTSTRAMALGQDGLWYTTVQGGITFGRENTAAAYEPD